MSPIDYLRAMVKRGRTPATGGLVTSDQAGIVVEPAGYLMPTTAAPASTEAKPIAVVEISGTVTEADAEQIRQQIQIQIRTLRTPAADKTCGCWPRYSYCTCSR